MTHHQDIDTDLQNLNEIARRMDALFRIPRTQITVGFDTILGLIPVIGDTIAHIPSAYIIWRGYKLGASPGTIAYMILNTLIDWAVGSIPVLGDIFDTINNSNIRNVRALETNLNKKAARAKTVRTAKKLEAINA